MSNSIPFLEVRSFAREAEAEVQPQSFSEASPFRSVYELEGLEGATNPETEAYLSFMTELHDEEMDEALYELVDEARGMHEESFLPGALGNERMLEQHFAPLVKESEAMLEAMAYNLGSREASSLTEGELETLDQYEPSGTLSPAQEYFFGRLKKLAKKAIRGAVKLAKKGISLATKLGLGPLLQKLKALIRPLLQKVLQMAIGRLPTSVQPLARKLAEKLGLAKAVGAPAANPAAAATDAASGADAPVADTTDIQQEFNYQIANLVFAPGEVEQELEVARVLGESRQPNYLAIPELDQAREQFVDGLQSLKEGEDPTPYVQNFLPALLPVLRLGLRLTGRKRVVDFLAKLVGKLIQRFVGPQSAPALSQAIVDTGLRLMSLETTPQDEARAASSTVAATVEETLRQVAAMPDYVLDNQELLEGFTLEAFEQAAASYLPPILPDAVYRQRPDLQEGRSIGGTAWVGMPLRSRKWCYLKCPRTFTVRITPQLAETIETFEGNTLSNFFYEQMGLPAGEAVEAEVHLYEATHHSTLADLARHETQVAGLGSAEEAATVQLHPLTPDVAGLLLDDPSLGREVSPQTLSHRRAIGSGQRVYHLALKGARPLMVPGADRAKVRRHSGVKRIRLDFPADQIKVHFFLSEIRAQQFAVSLRKQAHLGTLIASVKRIFQRGLLPALSGLRPGKIQIVHGALLPDQALGGVLQKLPGFVVNAFSRTLQGWLLEGLAEHLKQQSQKLIAATEDSADGITLVFTLSGPPGFAQLRELIGGKMLLPQNLDFRSGKPQVSVDVFPGFKND